MNVIVDATGLYQVALKALQEPATYGKSGSRSRGMRIGRRSLVLKTRWTLRDVNEPAMRTVRSVVTEQPQSIVTERRTLVSPDRGDIE
jgi:hypothetical protein